MIADCALKVPLVVGLASLDVRVTPESGHGQCNSIADISQVDIYRASQTVYLKRLQGMVIHSRHGDRDGYKFNKFSALRLEY